MAFASDSTTAPALQPRLLPFVFRPVPPVDDSRSADELLDEIRRTIERQAATLARACPSRGNKGLAAGSASPGRPLLRPADHARALHMRRELHQALDHGFALLDALSLSPLALDVIDDAIAHLDALEAADEDLEPYLAGYSADPFYDPRGQAEDADSLEIFGEGDFYKDAEDDDPAEETSLETAGRGFVRAGADDTEDDDPAERDEDHGSEDEAHPWRCNPSLVAFAVQVAHV